MELQCKERVDLLEALRKSRLDAEEDAKSSSDGPAKSKESLLSINKPASNGSGGNSGPWLGSDTVPQANYADIPRPSPVPQRRQVAPKRPSYLTKKSTDTARKVSDTEAPRAMSLQSSTPPKLQPPPTPDQGRARTPSPDKKSGSMLKTLRSGQKERSGSSKMVTTLRNKAPPAAAKAATHSWSGQQRPSVGSAGSGLTSPTIPSATTWDPYTRSLKDVPRHASPSQERRSYDQTHVRPPSPSDYMATRSHSDAEEIARKHRQQPAPYPDYPMMNPYARQAFSHSDESVETAKAVRPSPQPTPPLVPRHDTPVRSSAERPKQPPSSVSQLGQTSISYMKEYPNHPAKPKAPPVPPKPTDRMTESESAARLAPPRTKQAQSKPTIPRKAVGNTRAVGQVSATAQRQRLDSLQAKLDHRAPPGTRPGYNSSSPEPLKKRLSKRRTGEGKARAPAGRTTTPPSTDESPDEGAPATPTEQEEWDKRVKEIMKNLPKGVDEGAAKQIFNEIVIQGDEVHWDDVAGLEIAKSALKETVVYPFLRPDLFMGLREPARGMLLFGPPGTGKTMLARAVATESKSVFFAISASSLTSKFLGESEKLVRALFAIAKTLAPSIIFVDEIDSLLGARGGGSEHEATRRIKTEFLIQWSDLQKAAAGREDKDKARGDATRVLVLAATNLPWAIDEAARRRFVRRQYIPLPEPWVREQQLRTLLSAQKHSLNDRHLGQLVELTDGFSGSDITALAKDAAMGPLRSLGERLLDMRPDEIGSIGVADFERSLVNIRPSVGRKGLEEFEEWAREFGERGG